jgi:hypothetical protein
MRSKEKESIAGVDLGRDVPCSTVWRPGPGKAPSRHCQNPAVYRVILRCPGCGWRYRELKCQPCMTAAFQGKIRCNGCWRPENVEDVSIL